MEQRTTGLRLAHRSPEGNRVQTVKEHLEGTAELAAEFARPFGGESQARLAGLLHDIGKYSEEFQRRLDGGPKVDHSTAGAKVAYSRRHPEVAFAVAGHHGGLPDGGGKSDPDDAPTLMGRCRKQVPSCDGWQQEIDLPQTYRPDFPEDNFSRSFYIRMLYSCLVDADYLDTETFMRGRPVLRSTGQPLEMLLQYLRNYVEPWWSPATELNRKRCQILGRCLEQGRTVLPGMFTLTVPTGGGKTISSLAFALTHAVVHKKRRVIYVIPYTSIIDQTAAVFADILGDENVLEHHSGSEAALADLDTGSAPPSKVLAIENWDAPVIVTTAVQFFESLFSNRASRCRKLHNPADIAQYYGYLLRATQKLMYLYGFPQVDLEEKGQTFDSETMNLLILCMGVMYGVVGAGNALKSVAKALGTGVEKQLLRKALTKGTIYPIVKSVSKWFGVKMTKEVFAGFFKKSIPVVGGVLGGSITFLTFKPCCDKLKASLQSTILSDPDYQSDGEDNIINVEYTELEDDHVPAVVTD